MPTVSNTSPISNLAWIGRLNLLVDQFSEVWIPKAVETELGNLPDSTVRKVIDGARQEGWLKSRAASDLALVNLLMVELHPGEAEAIALALELKADRLLIDEREGRTLARPLGFSFTEPRPTERSKPSNQRLTPCEPRPAFLSRLRWRPPF